MTLLAPCRPHPLPHPPQGFVMNRVQGDYFETLLYKIFVSIDEYTDMKELSSVLMIDLEQVKVGSHWSP